VIMLNECGVDPGLDHMSAKKIIDEVHSKGGKIVKFTSYCGGLPAPDANDNPFGYKLSWSPRGVLLASRNDAVFYQDGEIVRIKGEDLFDHYEVVEVPGAGKFEGYHNRDSTSYRETYGIPEAKTCCRGTYRSPGWCRTLKKMADLGFLALSPVPAGLTTYAQLSHNLGNGGGDDGKVSSGDARNAVAGFLKLDKNDDVLNRFQWIGMFDETPIPEKIPTILDALCHLFQAKLVYKPGERDMLVMHHTFRCEYEDGKKEERTSTMLDFGIANGDTSMSRTVTLPVAIAIHMILQRKYTKPGIVIPITPEWYLPILEETEQLGIKFTETCTTIS